MISRIDFTPITKIKGAVNREGIRKMTPREWARLQGFPDNYVIPGSRCLEHINNLNS